MKKTLLFFTMLMVSIVLAYAQSRQVTGKITGDDGAGVPFATLQIKGTTRGTTADENGAFQLSVANGAVLVVRAVGFETKEFPVGSESSLSIALVSSNKTLDEVVVTALGLKRSSSQLGYSVAKVDNTNLNNAKVTNITTGLQAKVSGLQINLINNGVNPQTRVVLRGNRSLTGNNQAMVVVDGVPVPQSVLAALNPNDVEDVSVLKGANAAALYGSEGVNGVLIITTKRGKEGKTNVNFSHTTSLETVAYMPDMQYEFGGGYDLETYVPYENTSWGPKFDGSIVDVGPELVDGSQYQLKYSPLKDEKRNFFDKGLTIQNDVSVSGGDEKGTFFASLQDVKVTGIVPDDEYRRTGARFNATRKYGILTTAFNVGYTTAKQDYTLSDVYVNLLNIPQNIPITQLKDWKNNKFASPDGYFSAYYMSPYWGIANHRQITRTDVFSGNVEFNLKPTSWFDVLYRVGMYNETSNFKSWRGKLAYTDAYERPANESGNVKDGATQTRRINSDLILNFSKTFGDFNTRLLLGNNIRDNRTNDLNTEGTAIVSPELYNISNRLGEAIVNQSNTNHRQIAAYAELSAGYKNFLFVTLTGRNEWISLLSKANRSYFYPGASASFVFTEGISALKGNNTLSYGKVIFSANKTANVSLSPYQLKTTFDLGSGFPFGSLPGFSVGDRFAQEALEPEFVNSIEAGLQLGFFRDRLNVEATYFDSKADGTIVPMSTSWSTGYSSAWINAGSLQNRGIELDIKGTPINTPNIRWEIGFNYTYLDNKVTSLYQGLNEIPLGGYENAAYVYAMRDQQYPALKVTANRRDEQGRIIVSRTTGNPLQDPVLKNVGQTNPRTRIGAYTTFRFKEFTISGNIDYRAGNVFYNRLMNMMDFTGLSAHSAAYDREPFVVPNSVYDDGTGKLVPNTTVKTQYGGFDYWYSRYRNINENYVSDAKFLKLRELSVGYELPKGVLSKQNFVKRATVSLVGRNLFTWLAKDNENIDPEFNFTEGNAVGVSAFQTPPTKFYGANLSVTF
ncbi:SusC/RagA family TonB-linked outer membrane protein [Chitinophaga horti]|uniref:SusC/RagA family TonB-linked outer membrane protein n=1 Tax=Chitinophaga horti TaxID=2920382 RepID=A0ABY6IX37_9BACT|nr:SusC/RagA family TonB-linked outer membrane protein [Chitinophaga horti]UYQ91855.1 SusC/RagA family TonB-linked outer membrane protein [Chitinophaga horti]